MQGRWGEKRSLSVGSGWDVAPRRVWTRGGPSASVSWLPAANQVPLLHALAFPPRLSSRLPESLFLFFRLLF